MPSTNFSKPVKKWHEYTNEEIRNIERTKDAYTDSYLQYSNKAYDSKFKLSRPDLFPRTKIHKANLERFERSKAEALERINECEKHLKAYHDGANCRFY